MRNHSNKVTEGELNRTRTKNTTTYIAQEGEGSCLDKEACQESSTYSNHDNQIQLKFTICLQTSL